MFDLGARPNRVRFAFCFDCPSKLCVVGEVVIIVGARTDQHVVIEEVRFDHNNKNLLGKDGS